ncbi:MAG: crotonase/enoyl-CoA hydratase family protein [Rhizobiales bacterium]|nr:crotonase/enoyl-CoA hydratase family protein [Hyphomicrobiales bacterium]
MEEEYKTAFLTVSRKNKIQMLTLNRADKCNAVCHQMMHEIREFFESINLDETHAVVIHGAGKHFSAGLDLGEHKARGAYGAMLNSAFWHKSLDQLEFGQVPVVAAMHGGAIGGGLEIATACHVRVAEPTSFYELPEGRKGTYTGGGASIRVQRIIGADRMREMMLTGRVYNAEEGQIHGLSHYLVGEGEALNKAIELAEHIAGNSRMSNYIMINAIPRIADMDRMSGSFTENLAAGIVHGEEDAFVGIDAFLSKRKIRYDD